MRRCTLRRELVVLVLNIEDGRSGRTGELVHDFLADGLGCAYYDADEAVLASERCQFVFDMRTYYFRGSVTYQLAVATVWREVLTLRLWRYSSIVGGHAKPMVDRLICV